MVNPIDILLNPKPTTPETIPLEASAPSVETLSRQMLPAAIADFVYDVSDRSQCPPEYVAVAAIIALGSVVGGKYALRPKQSDHWEILPNLWGALIGPPSAMKSPALKEALKPLVKLEKSLTSAVATEQQDRKLLSHLKAIEYKKKQKEAEALYEQGQHEDALDLLKNHQLEEHDISPPRLIVNDTTVEKLGELLNENPNGLLLARDELHGFLARLAREENQSERAFYLECFDGNGRFSYDRIGRGTIVIEHCILSVVGGIQPSKIANLCHLALSGKADDGLIQRMQLSVWPDKQPQKSWLDRSPDLGALERYEQVIHRLHGRERRPEGPIILRFAPDAQVLFMEWWESLQGDIDNDEFHPVVQSHFGKYPKTIGALALIFQLCTGMETQVEMAAMEMALAWASFLRSHALRLYSAFDSANLENAKRLLKRHDKLPVLFTVRDVRRKGWAGLKDNADINAALDCLVDHHYLLEIPQPPGTYGGRPTIQYRWSPALSANGKTSP
ncbi:MAG: hypothetical protein VR73_13745 [Gammaproteobacteria bacterium BRH_c0]|nr:MAG: hypothetical protein VR73_13745 [Gammaproteobacteria bacterium BRH_c0]